MLIEIHTFKNKLLIKQCGGQRLLLFTYLPLPCRGSSTTREREIDYILKVGISSILRFYNSLHTELRKSTNFHGSIKVLL